MIFSFWMDLPFVSSGLYASDYAWSRFFAFGPFRFPVHDFQVRRRFARRPVRFSRIQFISAAAAYFPPELEKRDIILRAAARALDSHQFVPRYTFGHWGENGKIWSGKP
jgi:hypothetical protein